MASERIECTRCGSLLAKTQFYKSNSDLCKYSQKISICKECLNDLYEKYKKELKSDIKALYKLTMQLDIFFDEKLFETSKDKHIESNMSLPIYYFSKIGLSQYKGKTFGDSSMLDIWSKDKVEIKIEDKKDEKNKVTKEMIQRWGSTLDKDDYIFLNDKFESLCRSYDTSNPLSIWTYEEISRSYLDMRKADNPQERKQIYETISKMQSDCKMKASQVEDNANEVYSDFIKMVENEEPIPVAHGIFADVDNIKKYIIKWFVKPFARSLQLDDDSLKGGEGDSDDN